YHATMRELIIPIRHNCSAKGRGGLPTPPYAFTEHDVPGLNQQFAILSIVKSLMAIAFRMPATEFVNRGARVRLEAPVSVLHKFDGAMAVTVSERGAIVFKAPARPTHFRRACNCRCLGSNPVRRVRNCVREGNKCIRHGNDCR